MSGGSLQLRQFRAARRSGVTIEVAARLAGIGIGEARLIAADDARDPPTDDAFARLGDDHCSACGAHACGHNDFAWAGRAA